MPEHSLLEMRGIEIQFPGVKALDKVDFSLRAGEIHALLGENGAGKSTLVKCLTGVHHMDAGTILFDGKEIRRDTIKVVEVNDHEQLKTLNMHYRGRAKELNESVLILFCSSSLYKLFCDKLILLLNSATAFALLSVIMVFSI